MFVRRMPPLIPDEQSRLIVRSYIDNELNDVAHGVFERVTDREREAKVDVLLKARLSLCGEMKQFRHSPSESAD